jgi:hypothetical protein
MAARRLKAVPPITTKKFRPETYPYPECRGDVHSWAPFDGRLDEVRKIGTRIQKCVNCPTMRTSQMSLRESTKGQLVKKPTYKYPDDYRVEGGLDARDKGLLKMANFMHEIDQIRKGKA